MHPRCEIYSFEIRYYTQHNAEIIFMRKQGCLKMYAIKSDFTWINKKWTPESDTATLALVKLRALGTQTKAAAGCITSFSLSLSPSAAKVKSKTQQCAMTMALYVKPHTCTLWLFSYLFLICGHARVYENIMRLHFSYRPRESLRFHWRTRRLPLFTFSDAHSMRKSKDERTCVLCAFMRTSESSLSKP